MLFERELGYLEFFFSVEMNNISHKNVSILSLLYFPFSLQSLKRIVKQREEKAIDTGSNNLIVGFVLGPSFDFLIRDVNRFLSNVSFPPSSHWIYSTWLSVQRTLPLPSSEYLIVDVRKGIKSWRFITHSVRYRLISSNL